MRYADILVENKSKYVDNPFTYRLEDGSIQIGDRVLVPFGQYNKEKAGYVLRFIDHGEHGSYEGDRVKSMIGKDDSLPLNEEIMTTVSWMKQRYGIKYFDCIRCFIPSGKPAKAGKEKEPYKGLAGDYKPPEKLTDEQAAAAARINDSIRKNQQDIFLLHGVTSSGKTQVYMEAIETCLSMGKTAIMLVPEIALTSQMIQRFAGRFGKEILAVMHSKLTGRERYDEWQRIRKGEARIIIGARMGVFAPASNIGLIVMDEEHESTYKADMTPKYETVDVALKRLKYYDGVLLLGSATPSVVSYQRCKEGIYQLLELKERYNKTPLPNIEIVDMRRELKEGNTTIFSRDLYTGMKETLTKGKQVILFQNRRGYSNFISCRECGIVLRCPKCGISLTYHKQNNRAVCHYCGRRFPVPTRCPECDSKYIKFFGVGTEQVEEAVAAFFPEASAERLDLDTMKTRKDMDRILERFNQGKSQILIGTQLVAKGLDFQNVGLVGVIAADVMLNIPDYRSSERTFQLVTQVAGRAGRGRERGLVLVQTYDPENYALLAAKDHDYHGFFRQEIGLRTFMEYPPFSDLIMVNFTAEEETVCIKTAERCKFYMEHAVGEEQAKGILSPRVAINFKGEDFRYYVFIKCPRGNRNQYMYYLDNFNGILIKEKIPCNMSIDVNPYSTM
ncbi:MAG: primosomal protein N' [Firmicutes bacterium]|nr:primosomal protein N' [Bacillota bacterium]